MKTTLIAIILWVLAGLSSAGAEPITVAWCNKPPYHYLENGVGKGFLMERAKLVFATAGVPTQFVEEPAKRIWQNFAEKKMLYCSIGWYR